MFDLDAWVDGDTLTEVSSPGRASLGKKDGELNSDYVDNLGISEDQFPLLLNN